MNVTDRADGYVDVTTDDGKVYAIPGDAPGVAEIRAQATTRSATPTGANDGTFPGVNQALTAAQGLPSSLAAGAAAGAVGGPGAAMAATGAGLAQLQSTQLQSDQITGQQMMGIQEDPMLPGLGGYGQSRLQGLQLPGIPGVGMNRFQQGVLDTYDVESGVVASARDERDALMQQGTQTLEQQQGRLGTIRDVAEQDAYDTRDYMMGQRAQLQKSQQALNDLVSQGVNPNRIFENGTVSRTQAAIAGAIGGVFTGGTGQNTALGVLERMIDRDMQAQMQTIQAQGMEADNLLSSYAQAFGSFETAQTAFKMSELEYQMKELQTVASRIDTVEARENANRLITQLQREKNGLEMQFDQQNQAARAAAIQRRNQLVMQAMMANGMDERQFEALDPDLRKRISTQAEKLSALDESGLALNALEERFGALREKWGGNAPGVGEIAGRLPDVGYQVAEGTFGSEEALDALELRALMNEFKVQSIQGKMSGVLSDRDIAMLTAAMPKTSDTENEIKRKLSVMRTQLADKRGYLESRDPTASQWLNRANARKAGPQTKVYQ